MPKATAVINRNPTVSETKRLDCCDAEGEEVATASYLNAVNVVGRVEVTLTAVGTPGAIGVRAGSVAGTKVRAERRQIE